MNVRDQFTDQELEAIRAATREAEKETGGELVCVIVNRCDTYQAPVWQAAALGAVGGAVAAGIWHSFADVWSLTLLSWILLPSILGATIGLLAILLLPPLRRWLIPPPILERRVDRRAASAFLDEEIFNTRDRTGVLLFVALFEHQVRILTDRGIDRQMPAGRWQSIVDQLTGDLHGGRPGEAIVDAISACGQLLAEHRIARRTDDQNELADKPRLIDE